MRRTLFYIPHEFFELGELGFGWLLIIWAVFGVGLLGWLIWRQGWNNDTASYLPVLGLVGLLIWWLLPQLEIETAAGSPLGLPIRGYGMMVMLGVIAGVSLALYQARRVGLDSEVIMSLAFWLFLSGIGGGRIFFVVQNWHAMLQRGADQNIDWVATGQALLSVTQGGLVVYGAFLGAVVAAIVFFYVRKLPALAITDLVAPSLLVGLAIGRIGCLMNGCCYGGICEASVPLPAISFPRDVSPEIDGSLSSEKRENSPPYHAQRELGMLHGIRIAPGPEGRPVIQRIDWDLISDKWDHGDKLAEGDIIRKLNGTTVDSFEAVRRQLGIFRLPRVSQLLPIVGPEIVVETSNGKLVSWSIGQMPARSKPIHPTQIYSAINAGLIALLLWAYYPFRRRDGQVVVWMLVVYPTTRFLLEMIRTDEPGRFGTALTISQWVSLGLIVLAITLWLYVLRLPQKTTLGVALDRG